MINKINFNNSKPSTFYINNKRVRQMVLNDDTIYYYIPCTGINIHAESIVIPDVGKKGDTYTVAYTISPSDCTEKVTWSIDDNQYVSINNGVLTRLVDNIDGSIPAITIQAQCESYKDSTNLEIEYTKVIARFDQHEFTVREGVESVRLPYNFIQGNGDHSLVTVTTTNSSDSGPNDVLYIYGVYEGYVDFIGHIEGTGYLHLYYDGELMDTCTVVSTPYASPCTGVSFNIDSQGINLGWMFDMGAHIIVSPSNCTDEVYLSSSNNSVARASGLTVYGEAIGSATITVHCGGYTDTCTVHVSELGQS